MGVGFIASHAIPWALRRYVSDFLTRTLHFTTAPQCADSQRRRRTKFPAVLHRAHAGLGFSADRRGDSVWLAGHGGAAPGTGFDALFHACLAADRQARRFAAHSPRDLAGDPADTDAPAASAGWKRYQGPARRRH